MENLQAKIILQTLTDLGLKIDKFQENLASDRERIVALEVEERSNQENKKTFNEITWPNLEEEVRGIKDRLVKIEKETVSLRKIENIESKLTTVLTKIEIWIPRMEKIEEKLPKLDEVNWKMKLIWAGSAAGISFLTASVVAIFLKIAGLG
jgi:hypothetical protein